ncbi:uncharacterized protein Dana_GF26813 [Drosophila ananassae]|uniref:Kazal-like domain-containing protein n=1 Tax=Drosophila ananassae TaxID=7217 RepID=A0A0P8XGA5_DROAN|nr:uncharacterized protein LOC26514222 isoform X2 [Drosophila ananassae]KPU73705.1 uncharacterized protein Dana_GF26813 [Drosophila ananassae]
MRIYLLGLLGMLILRISRQEDSCQVCSWKTNIHCGIAADDSCAFGGLNKCLVERASCLRQMNNLTRIFYPNYERKMSHGQAKMSKN